MNAKIRETTEQDLEAILSIYAQPDMDNGHSMTLDEARRLFQKIRSYPDYQIYVADVEEKIVGTFSLLIMDALAHLGAPVAIVEDVAVDPRWQNRGIGKQMMRFAMDSARAKGCYKLALSSNLKRKAAHQFYRSLGFAQHGVSFHVELPTQ
jgi:GNAT superfamily N-acetyltransferase